MGYCDLLSPPPSPRPPTILPPEWDLKDKDVQESMYKCRIVFNFQPAGGRSSCRSSILDNRMWPDCGFAPFFASFRNVQRKTHAYFFSYCLISGYFLFCVFFLFQTFGIGSVAQTVLSRGKYGTFFTINFGWGIGVTLGIYWAGGISGEWFFIAAYLGWLFSFQNLYLRQNHSVKPVRSARSKCLLRPRSVQMSKYNK